MKLVFVSSSNPCSLVHEALFSSSQYHRASCACCNCCACYDYVADMQMEELLVKRKKMVSCSTPWLVMSTQKLFKKLTRLHVCLKILLLTELTCNLATVHKLN